MTVSFGKVIFNVDCKLRVTRAAPLRDTFYKEFKDSGKNSIFKYLDQNP